MICKDLAPVHNPIKLLFTSYVKSHLQLFILFCRATWSCDLMRYVLDREVSAPNLVAVFKLLDKIKNARNHIMDNEVEWLYNDSLVTVANDLLVNLIC